MTPSEQKIDNHNKLIKVPLKLTTDDGREIQLITWHPCVTVESLTTVEIKGYIMSENHE